MRELQHASLQLERDDVEQDADYARWLRMLVSPGGSVDEVVVAVRNWRRVAEQFGIGRTSQQRMARAFRIADK